MTTTATTPDQLGFSALLQEAIAVPGRVHEAYSAFHNYSIGNQLLALMQCHQRGIAPGPIATFAKWKERGRYVQKGEKAVVLCQPVTVKKTTEGDHGSEEIASTRFLYRRNWFLLAQTAGQEFQIESIPTWDKARALSALGIEEIPFEGVMSGNVWGFARGKQIAISPLSPLPARTMLHEIAHVVLGHTTEHEQQDGDATPRNIREVEAEGVALLCASALGLEGIEYSRGYLQHWLGAGNEIPERACQRIFKAADTILKAGRECPQEAL
jgi:hypothetical protein